MSLRQVMVRLMSLPPESPTWAVIDELDQQAQARRRVVELDNTLAPFKK